MSHIEGILQWHQSWGGKVDNPTATLLLAAVGRDCTYGYTKLVIIVFSYLSRSTGRHLIQRKESDTPSYRAHNNMPRVSGFAAFTATEQMGDSCHTQSVTSLPVILVFLGLCRLKIDLLLRRAPTARLFGLPRFPSPSPAPAVLLLAPPIMGPSPAFRFAMWRHNLVLATLRLPLPMAAVTGPRAACGICINRRQPLSGTLSAILGKVIQPGGGHERCK